MYQSTIQIITNLGSIAQWGLSLTSKNEEQNEIYPENFDKMAQFIIADPYSPSINTPIFKVACGLGFALALNLEGQIISWGANNVGQLGQNDYISRIDPLIIPYFVKDHIFITDISVGAEHCLALSYCNGKVYSWGGRQAPTGAQIKDGFGNIINYMNYSIYTVHQKEPREVKEILNNYKIIKIAAGSNFSCAITDNGQLYTWGDNEYSQLGLDLQDDVQQNFINIVLPTQVIFFRNKLKGKITEVSCGFGHVIATFQKQEELKEQQLLLAWGNNDCGQCGIGDDQNLDQIKFPTIVQFEEEIYQMSAGKWHSLILTKNKQLFGFGRNENGLMGIINQNQKFFKKPTNLTKDLNYILKEDLEIVKIAATSTSSALLLKLKQSSKQF